MDNAASFAFSGTDETPSPQPGSARSSVALPSISEALYRLRRRRERLFDAELFSDPAWDLLLDLMTAEQAGNRISITSACIATAAPTTTALRCLRRLEDGGVVYREADASDRRRIYVRLSKDAVSRMEALLKELVPCSERPCSCLR